MASDDTGRDYSVKKFDTANDFELWWRNPYGNGVDDDFELYWEHAEDLQSGTMGAVKKFRIQAAKTMFEIVVKKLNKTVAFLQSVGVFNANLQTHASIMPSFYYPGRSEPLAPCMHGPFTDTTTGKQFYLCMMGFYADLLDQYFDYGGTIAQRSAIVSELDVLRRACEDGGIAVPDFKLENVGAVVNAENVVTRLVFLDIDSLFFMDNCFSELRGNATEIPITMTYVGLCVARLKVHGDAVGVSSFVRTQLRYLTSMLFYFFMGQVALHEGNWDPNFNFAPKQTNTGSYRTLPPGTVFQALSKRADEMAESISKADRFTLRDDIRAMLADVRVELRETEVYVKESTQNIVDQQSLLFHFT